MGHLKILVEGTAVAIVQQGQQSINPIVEFLSARIDQITWREVSLLCIGYVGIIQ